MGAQREMVDRDVLYASKSRATESNREVTSQDGKFMKDEVAIIRRDGEVLLGTGATFASHTAYHVSRYAAHTKGRSCQSQAERTITMKFRID